MIVRRLVVFSGFDARVVERIRPELEAQQTDVVVVKLWPELGAAYFDKLLNRMRTVADLQLGKSDVRMVALLVSCVSEAKELARERDVFWPMLRRLAVERAFSRDVRRASDVSQQIISLMKNPDFLSTYDWIKPAADAVLALPVRNTGSDRLKRELGNLYELGRFHPTPGLDRFVQRLKGRRGLRSRSVVFCGCQNNARHPVRRRTDSTHCDLSGRFRLGFSVPPRFEFDVTCETGVAGKTFQQCDGSATRVPAAAKHLNMRINDDFDW